MRRMRTSKAGLELIKSFEGYRPRAAQLPDRTWTIGYSHTQSARENLRITKADAESVLREYDLPPIESMLGASVLAPLTQNQFDALVSFAFNIGTEAFEGSDVLTHLNSGSTLLVADAMMTWRKARLKGQVMVVDALVRRRAMEQALFLSHPNGAPVAPSGFVRPISGLGSAIDLVSVSAAAASAAKSVAETRTVKAVVEPLRAEPAQRTKPDVDPEHAGPTPDEITRAISALANPDTQSLDDGDLPPIRLDEPHDVHPDIDHDDLLPPPFLDDDGGTPLDAVPELVAASNGKMIIDDLAPVEVDPLLLQQVAENSKSETRDPTTRRSGTVLHTILGLVGIGLAGFAGQRLVDEGKPITAPGQSADIEQYLNIGGVVLGAFLVLMALVFMIRRRPS